MSGWKMNCDKYKATEKLFTDIWTSLVQVADTDHDGKITRLQMRMWNTKIDLNLEFIISYEWLAMWEAYKKHLIEKEKETENFLEQFYNKNDPDFRKLKSLGTHLGDTEEQKTASDKWKRFEEVKHSESLEATILPTWLNDYLRFREIKGEL